MVLLRLKFNTNMKTIHKDTVVTVMKFHTTYYILRTKYYILIYWCLLLFYFSSLVTDHFMYASDWVRPPTPADSKE